MKKTKLLLMSCGLLLARLFVVDCYSQTAPAIPENHYRVKRLQPFMEQICKIQFGNNQQTQAIITRITPQYIEVEGKHGPFYQSIKKISIYDVQSIQSGTRQERFAGCASHAYAEGVFEADTAIVEVKLDSMLAFLEDHPIGNDDQPPEEPIEKIRNLLTEEEQSLTQKALSTAQQYNPIQLLRTRSKNRNSDDPEKLSTKNSKLAIKEEPK
ncbi:hypothetical protein JXJ21_25330 [candidate division KSB1 bacterium]|nr:hypothetical protein [candidate division KSB1 bacterium]